MSRVKILGAWLATLLCVATAAAAEPVTAWTGPSRPFGWRDISFQKAAEDEYVESLGFTASFQGDASFDLSIVVTNLGMGDNNAGIKSDIAAGGHKEKSSIEVDDDWRQRPGLIELAKTRIEGSIDRLHVWHETDTYAADLVFKRTAPSWRPGSGRASFGKSGKRFYEFSLPMPMAKVEGTLRIGSRWFTVVGTGYIDHSRTNIYSHEQALRWQRFRGVQDGVLLQFTRFITTAKYGSRPIGWLVVLDSSRILYESFKYDLQLLDLRPDRTHKDYQVAWRYELHADSAVDLSAKAIRQTSRTDYLASMGTFKRMIVKRFAQPIAVGLRCEYQATLRLPDGERKLAGRGSMSQTFVK